MTKTIASETIGNPARAAKYLTFTLREESYGISVLAVREIIPNAQVTPVPKLPDYVEGVINLRGKIIPVVHLAARFGFPRAEATERTCIIVAQITAATGAPAQYGLIVDAVEEVISIASEDIEPAPNFHSAIGSDCIAGLANVGGNVKTLLDIAKTLQAEPVA